MEVNDRLDNLERRVEGFYTSHLELSEKFVQLSKDLAVLTAKIETAVDTLWKVIPISLAAVTVIVTSVVYVLEKLQGR